MTRYVPQWLQAGSYAASQDRRLLAALWPAPASSGCQVNAGAAMTATIAAGQVAVPSQNNTGTTLCTSDAVENVALPAASSLDRIDLIICRPRGNDLDGGSNNDFIFDSVQGTPAASPGVPAAPAGTVALARVYIPANSATLGTITDMRPGALAIANALNLPPPVTSGSTIQSYIDPNGVQWVAKNGVNGGLWRQARDVLRARVYRQAAFTSPTAVTVFGFDTNTKDAYGLQPSGGTFVAPVAGVYEVLFAWAATPTAAGQWLRTQINQNAGSAATTVAHSGGTTILSVITKTQVFAAANDSITYNYYASAALAGGAGPNWSYGEFTYLGTG